MGIRALTKYDSEIIESLKKRVEELEKYQAVGTIKKLCVNKSFKTEYFWNKFLQESCLIGKEIRPYDYGCVLEYNDFESINKLLKVIKHNDYNIENYNLDVLQKIISEYYRYRKEEQNYLEIKKNVEGNK